ncbi:hypothetical protein LPJ79_005949, partial [Coemansia sp. RSA 1821]
MFTSEHFGTMLDAVMLLASFASIALSHRRYTYKQPIFMLGMLAGALCLTVDLASTVHHTAFVSAAASLVMLSAVHPRDSNFSACLHLARAARLVWRPEPLALAPAILSTALHLVIAWNLSSNPVKQTMLCHIRGIFMVGGFKLFLWLGKCQRLTVSDIHDPACEEIYRDDVQTMKFNPAQ